MGLNKINVKLKFWVLVWPRIKPGQDRKVHVYKEFWWFEIHRACDIIGRGKNIKINFNLFSGTDSLKNWPILQESLWQTSPKSNRLN